MAATATRQRKIECPECGYIARTTRKNIERGLPTCPCGSQLVPELAEDRALAPAADACQHGDAFERLAAELLGLDGLDRHEAIARMEAALAATREAEDMPF